MQVITVVVVQYTPNCRYMHQRPKNSNGRLLLKSQKAIRLSPTTVARCAWMKMHHGIYSSHIVAVSSSVCQYQQHNTGKTARLDHQDSFGRQHTLLRGRVFIVRAGITTTRQQKAMKFSRLLLPSSMQSSLPCPEASLVQQTPSWFLHSNDYCQNVDKTRALTYAAVMTRSCRGLQCY